jgi:chemotaxis protein methyltransferase CheR
MALLARIYANRGELSEALDCCRKAISVDKLNPAYHYLLATVLQEQKQFEEASLSLRRALYIDQGFVPAHFALGNLSLQRRKFRESRKHFENALSLLGAYKPEDILPEAEGMTAGRLMEIIRATTHMEKSA